MMRFDQVRREFKKTLWGEELDYERQSSQATSSIELDFLHQYTGKKYSCVNCLKEYEENFIVITNQGTFCTKCYQALISNDGQ